METFSLPLYISFVNPVVSLPMRDGNWGQGYIWVRRVRVVSLPMRDGNSATGNKAAKKRNVVSLPMRDGNSNF